MKKHPFSCVAALLLSCISPATAGRPDSLFPQIEGWKLTQDETVYKPSNLWDVIDGAADLFLEYNFVGLHIGRYQKSDDLEIKVELYRHSSHADAFGIYSQERFPDYHFIDLGVQGYIEKGALNFLAGTYYVKISTVQSGKEVQDAMLMIGKKVEEHLKQPKTWPALLSVFPSTGKQPNSEQYIAKSFMGYSSLNGAFVASYDDGTQFKAFVIQEDTPEMAKKMLDGYLNALPKDTITKRDEGRYKVKDPHGDYVDLQLKSTYLIGLLSADGSRDRERFLYELGSSLPTLK